MYLKYLISHLIIEHIAAWKPFLQIFIKKCNRFCLAFSHRFMHITTIYGKLIIEKMFRTLRAQPKHWLASSLVMKTVCSWGSFLYPINIYYIPGKSCLKRALGFLRGGGGKPLFSIFWFSNFKKTFLNNYSVNFEKKIVVIIGGLRWPEKNNLADSAISGQNITSITKNRQFWALSKCIPQIFVGKIFLIKWNFFAMN